MQEAGIARFDVVQQSDDPARFVLVEVYRSAEASAQHKETKHYQMWRDAAYRVTPRDFPLLVEKASVASRMQGNPIKLMKTNAAITAALEAASSRSIPSRQTRLLLIGSHHAHLGLVDAIEEDGRARIVGEDSACDEREVMLPIQTAGDRAVLVGALAAHSGLLSLHATTTDAQAESFSAARAA